MTEKNNNLDEKAQQELELEVDNGSDIEPDSSNSVDDIATESAPLEAEMGPLKEMIDTNFLQYASYVICERAIPNLTDGLKPVQRRILHALNEKDDGRFIKVANVVGHTMQYHPHGDASIGDALVNLTNKGFLIEGQGNFGNIYTGDRAAAARYIECRLTPLAREEVFNDNLTKFVPSYDGRNKEPVTFPSKLPLLLMLGAEGIAVGLSTRILPHNFIELLEAQVAVLNSKPFDVLPDFIQGGTMDASEYNDGDGSVRVRGTIVPGDNENLIITQLPFGTTTESLINSIEDAARKKKVPVKSINDFTSEKVEIELCLAPDTDQARAIEALYAFTSCEMSLNSNIVVIKDRHPVQLTITEVIKANTKHFLKVLKAELTFRRNQLLEEFHARTLTRIFIEERIYKRIEQCKTADAVTEEVRNGLAPFRNELNRDITKKDIETLLSLRIRRISLFDIDKNRKEIEIILAELEKIEKYLKNLNGYAIRTLNTLIKKYAEQYPRRTAITSFSKVEVRELTANELDIYYDKKSGYLGTKVKGEPMMQCSSYEKLILMWNDGRYKVMNPPDKVFVDKSLIYCAVADRDKVMTVIYTAEGLTYIKRFKTGGTVMNKEYLCSLPESKIIHFQEETPAEVYVKYKPAKGQRIHQQMFIPSDAPVKGAKARGNIMTSKAVTKLATKMPRWWNKDEKLPKGRMMD